MHNTNETPRIYYRVYGDNGNANHDVVKNIDEAMNLFVKVVKTSKTRRIHLDREEYIGNRCLIYNLATCQTVHELKKSAGVSKCRFAPSASSNATHCTTPLTGLCAPVAVIVAKYRPAWTATV